MKKRSLIIASIIAVPLLVLTIWASSAKQARTSAPPAYKVMLDGQKWFCINDKDKLEGLLEEYKNQYVSTVAKDAKIKSVKFKQKLDIIAVPNQNEDLISWQQAKEKINARVRAAQSIEVKDGDNIWSIAKENQVSVEQLQKLNPQLGKEMIIYPGDELKITGEKPILDVLIEYQNTVVEDVPYTTEYISDSTMFASQRQVLSPGENGKQESVYDVVQDNNNIVERKAIHTKVVKSPIAAKVRVGTKKAISRGGGIFRVVSGGRITSGFGTRVHPITGAEIFHKGVDIGAAQGNPIYSYAGGTVIFAGWKSGYGNFVAIEHSNGVVTHYGHMSAIYVRVGQSVSAGQRIGAVGSTGASTGPHLHFEVLLNGEYKNPLNYL